MLLPQREGHMILRKLANAVTDQNWFTVVLEILIVVIGIFIGLQVDDWHQFPLRVRPYYDLLQSGEL